MISVHQRRKSGATDPDARGGAAVVGEDVASVGHGQGHRLPPLQRTLSSGSDLEGA